MSTLASDKVRTLHTAEVALRLIKFMAAQPKGLNLDEITKYLRGVHLSIIVTPAAFA